MSPALSLGLGRWAIAGRGALSLLVLLTTAWGAMALWYQLPLPGWGKLLAALLWAGAGCASIALMWRERLIWRDLMAYAVALLMLLSWWSTIKPSHERVWADDVSRMLVGKVDGDIVTINDVRNFNWRSDSDYDQRWETRSFDLNRLRSADVVLSYWMGPAIAHTLVTFGFDDGRYLTFSIEIRKERGESFSAIGGFFKRFETVLVAADERDILRVRTNVRGEDDYMYRIAMPRAQMRSLFLAYLDEGKKLKAEPRFYNTLTSNCTTIVFEMARRIVKALPFDYRLLASGYLDEYLFDVHGLMRGYSFKELREAGHFTERAKAADSDPGFSQAIRVGMPVAPK